jgi:hypothetical protein
VSLAEREQKLFAHHRLRRQLGVGRRLAQKPDIQFAVPQRDDLRARRQLTQLESNAGELRPKAADDSRQRQKHHRCRERNRERTGFATSGTPRRVGGVVEVGENVSPLRQKRFAGRVSSTRRFVRSNNRTPSSVSRR